MKHKDFIEEVARQTGMPVSKVANLTEQTANIVSEMLSDGDSIVIQGFGTFDVKKKEEFVSINPSTGKKWLIPPKLVQLFKPGPTLKEKIKNQPLEL